VTAFSPKQESTSPKTIQLANPAARRRGVCGPALCLPPSVESMLSMRRDWARSGTLNAGDLLSASL